MDTIYNWLLQNTGNEGNYYTILNVQRSSAAEGPAYLDVMARSKEFAIVNLFVSDPQAFDPTTINANLLRGRSQLAGYTFSSEQQVIDYLAEGKTPNQGSGSSIYLLVLSPTGDAGDITFPPTQ